MWRSVTPAFEREHQVVLPDHVGAGGSDLSAWSPARYGALEGYARDVLEICEELDLRDVVFVGHSVSAMIGVLAAAREPDRFAGLVLVGPSPRYVDDPPYRGGFQAADIEELLESLDSNYLGLVGGHGPGDHRQPRAAPAGRGADQQLLPHGPHDRAPLRPGHLHLRQPRGPRPRRRALPRPPVTRGRHRPARRGRVVHARIPAAPWSSSTPRVDCPNLSAPDQVVAAIRDGSWRPRSPDVGPTDDLDAGREERLHRAELTETAEDLYDNAPCGYLPITPDGYVVRINATLLTWLGDEHDEVVGRIASPTCSTVGGRTYHETHFAPLLLLQGSVHSVALESVPPIGAASGAGRRRGEERADDAPSPVRIMVVDAADRRAYQDELLRARRQADLERDRLQQLATTLQCTLLPLTLPGVPALDIAAYYHSASVEEIGGNFTTSSPSPTTGGISSSATSGQGPGPAVLPPDPLHLAGGRRLRQRPRLGADHPQRQPLTGARRDVHGLVHADLRRAPLGGPRIHRDAGQRRPPARAGSPPGRRRRGARHRGGQPVGLLARPRFRATTPPPRPGEGLGSTPTGSPRPAARTAACSTKAFPGWSPSSPGDGPGRRRRVGRGSGLAGPGPGTTPRSWCSLRPIRSAIDAADAEGIAERIADGEVGAVGLLGGFLLTSAPAATTSSNIAWTSSVVNASHPPPAPIVTSSRILAAVASSCAGAPGRSSRISRSVPGTRTVSQRMAPKSTSAATSSPSTPV